MRLALLSLTIIMGANIGLALIDHAHDVQLSRMDALCKVDSSYCK